MHKSRSNSMHNQTGTYLILLPAVIIAILAGLAIAMNTGNAVADRQRAQAASDAAALAGAFAVKREMTNLTGEDSGVKNAALGRVNEAVRVAAADNGFQHGVDGIQVNATWPPVYPNDDMEDYYEGVGEEYRKYIRVTVEKPMDYLFFKGILSSIPDKSIGAAAVGRVGTVGDGIPNNCPGLYIFGNAGKVLDLKFGSDFFIADGGIYIDYTGTGTALYGASGSSMTAEWIEQNIAGGNTSSVDYFCTQPPPTHACSPVNVSEERIQPTFEDLPTNSCHTPSETVMTKCINGGVDFGRCSQAACIASAGCTGLGCLPSKGCKKDCLNGTTCPGLPTTPPSVSSLPAREYCDGLTVVNTGTSSSPLQLIPNSSIPSNIFNLNGSNMTVINSQIQGGPAGIVNAEGEPYEGVVLLSSPQDGRGTGLLEIGNNKSSSASTLSGDLRVYFNAIQVYYSTLSINTFTEEGCGILPEIKTTVVQ